MGSEAWVVAIDQGTTSTRAILFDTTGRARATAQTELTQHHPRPGWVEHDPEEIWRSVASTCREVIAAADGPIAAIGIAVRRCITFHGLALNLNTDLSYFNRIIPCGLSWADVTSMARELGAEQNLVEVRDRYLSHFAELFGYSKIEKAEDGEWKIEDRDPPSSILHPQMS